MNNLSIAAGGLFVVSAIVSVNLWRELNAERVLTAQLRAELADSRTAEPSQRQSAAPGAPPATEPVVSTAAAAPVAADGEKAAPQPATAAAAPVPSPLFGPMDQQEMMKDPDYRAARLAQMRSSIAQSYPGLVEELELNPQEASRLFDALAELQMDSSSNNVSLILQASTGQPDAAALQKMAEMTRESQRRQEEVVSATLGPARYAQWQEYQQNRAGYMQASQLNRTMEGAGQPTLSASQSRAMREVYVAEQQRQRDDMSAMSRSLMANGGNPSDRFIEEQSKLQEGRNTRIIEAASRHLSPSQVEALRTSLEQQLAMSRAQTRMMRERLARQQPQGQ